MKYFRATWTTGTQWQDNTYGCRMCRVGYYGENFDTQWDTGSSKCTQGYKFPECNQIRQVTATTWWCYACNHGFAVNPTYTGCTAFTADPGCRVLGEDGTCYICHNGYFFSGQICILHSTILIGALFLLLTVLLVS